MASAGQQAPFDEDLVDFAVAVFQEDGRWLAAPLPPHVAESLDLFIHAVRQQASEGPTLGLLGLGDEYFIALRLVGPEERLFISEQAAAEEDEVAAQVLDRLGLAGDQGRGPAGDDAIFADLGLDPLELQLACEQLLDERALRLTDLVAHLAGRIGFARQFTDCARPGFGPADGY
ncbi:tRNA adenosine deaminase-associated protein [Actinospica sp. MGRD01-02]|uniref:tRNA adenosine deaminase-associated protein n=1 Tax=Actinospica acidithermotolerans TaxID=2828514 RepID=A0A941EE35_9ACTN|nr:tRNA adenosine deaminase-associated protein [Actinospica acidithermotolerans]MBR7828968.1 tRNA adenosine deaminase-associated protein [Actinospica acidithermotolerans]